MSDTEADQEETSENKGGRPAFEPTPEQRLSVEIWVFMKVAHPEMARRLGIGSINTLKKYFAIELAAGESRREGDLDVSLYMEAQKGSVAARKLVEEIRRDREWGPRPNTPAKAEEAAARPPKLGKKEQALVDAKSPDVSTSLGELMARRQSGETIN